MNWKDWPENLEDKNHFFLTGQRFAICFAIAYTGAVTLGRNTLVLCLYQSVSYCGQEYTPRIMHRHLGDKCFPQRS